MPVGKIYGTRLDWPTLIASWAKTRATEMRRHAAKVRTSYKQPAVVRRLERYARALEDAAKILDDASREIEMEASDG